MQERVKAPLPLDYGALLDESLAEMEAIARRAVVRPGASHSYIDSAGVLQFTPRAPGDASGPEIA